MEEKQICCCGSSAWTRVIAWFQIIGSVISIIVTTLFVIGAITLVSMDSKDLENLINNDSSITPEQIEKLKAGATTALIGFIGLLFLAVLAFVMGIFLLRGSKNRNPRHIHYWIVYGYIWLSIWVVAQCFIYPNATVIVAVLITLAIALVIQGFCLYVVTTHKKEIEASTGAVFPVKGLHMREAMGRGA